MEQDVLHRVSPPSKSAGVPRYSLVLKLCFYPKTATTAPTVARDGWGEPTRFGSASGLSAPPQLLQNDSQRLEYDKTDVIKRVTLVRHGQSTWNEEGRLQGSSDFSVLTPKGEAQAEITREMLQVRVALTDDELFPFFFLHHVDDLLSTG
jgi:probable phosphoglycerate mutase